MSGKLFFATFLLIAFFNIAQARFLEDEKKCSNNPANWCKNIQEAEACNVNFRSKRKKNFKK